MNKEGFPDRPRPRVELDLHNNLLQVHALQASRWPSSARVLNPLLLMKKRYHIHTCLKVNSARLCTFCWCVCEARGGEASPSEPLDEEAAAPVATRSCRRRWRRLISSQISCAMRSGSTDRSSVNAATGSTFDWDQINNTSVPVIGFSPTKAN